MDPPDIFEAVTYTLWPCPTPSGLAVGQVYIEIARPSSHELFFYQRVDFLLRENPIFAACNRLKKGRNSRSFLPFLPTAAIRGYLRLFF